MSTDQHFFVDEAGDLTLFNKRGASLVGREGVSSYFMLGVALVPNVALVEDELTRLRARLLADPYFQGVPSMSPSEKKTAICFHAKDDLPEVRREVFSILPSFGATVQVVIRRKADLVGEGRALHRRGLKLRSDDVYDEMVHRLFKDLPRASDTDVIIFARRGKSDRLQAVVKALSGKTPDERSFTVEVKLPARSVKDAMRQVGEIASAIEPKGEPMNRERTRVVAAAFPNEAAGLQVVDYYLWALQRMYERREDRFFKLLAPSYRLIMDLDDQRNTPAGEWYSASNPLTLEKIKPVTG